MENKQLLSLMTAIQPENRSKWALKWKQQGKKVIGLGCSHVPEEIVHAAGMLPIRLIGTWNPRLDIVSSYRPVAWTEPYVNHVLEVALKGEYNYLDGMVTTDWDEDRRQLYDFWLNEKITPFAFHMHLPRTDGDPALQYYTHELNLMKKALQEHFKVRITNESLWESIRLYDRWRSLMMEIYQMRKADEPPVNGGEALRLSEASLVMPKEEVINELEALLPELRKRRAEIPVKKPRLLVTGDMLDNPEYIDAIEGEGCLVVFDDLETSARHFWTTVGSDGDPMKALARRYLLGHIPGPRFYFFDKGIDQLKAWVQEYRIDAVLNLPLKDSYQRLFSTPRLTRRLKEAGIKIMTLEIEYHLEMLGQFRTRIGAFLEMVRQD